MKIKNKYESVIRIRRVKTRDIAQLALLSSQIGHEQSFSVLRRQIRFIKWSRVHAGFVAVDSVGDVVGWAHVFVRYMLYHKPRVELSEIVVDENFRGNGIGKLLVGACERWARERHIELLVVHTNVLRKEAFKFYEKIGYTLAKKTMFFWKEV
ncbi:MAG: GNAT family N-acetyltransferase [Spirochaetes bacterium]|nr:GNAT family N-acetyltransferase [Spirochaetota bacterium]